MSSFMLTEKVKAEYLFLGTKTNNQKTLSPFKHQPQKLVKHTQTVRWLLPTNCLSVFDYFVGLAFQGLNLLRVTQI